jgi:hypothetical protein
MLLTLIRERIYAPVLSPPRRIQLNWLTMLWVHFVMVAAGISPEQRGLLSVILPWLDAAPVSLLHRLLLLPSSLLHRALNDSPQRSPKRGAPWRPRRPPVTPPDSTSTESSPRHQTRSPPVSILQFNSMAVIPSTPLSTLRLSLDPLAFSANPCPSTTLWVTEAATPLFGGSPTEMLQVSLLLLIARVSRKVCLHYMTWSSSYGKR